MNALSRNGDFHGRPHPILFELIDKDGRKHGPFISLAQAVFCARFNWPDQTQDEDRTGKGWDVQMVGCDR